MRGELKNAAQPAGDADEQYVSIADACERFGISRSAAFQLIRQRGLTRYRRPRDSRTYVAVKDLEAALSRMPSHQRELIPSQGREPLACNVVAGAPRVR